jgi:hypothetical protein
VDKKERIELAMQEMKGDRINQIMKNGQKNKYVARNENLNVEKSIIGTTSIAIDCTNNIKYEFY